ncbi:hypothetical protein BY458DRAFT_510644 [Sporodiniella umbellata]|nr:hypothetical protein BY458DRAFT_510644 [Sporodiniella umbellata]
MMNPQMMGNPAWSSSRFPMDPNQLDYVVPYKQFNEYTRRNSSRRLDDEDIQKRYAHYKEKFAARQLSQFFLANKEKQWFLEKYHPLHSRTRHEDMVERRKRYLKDFMTHLEMGELDNVQFDKKTSEEKPEGKQDDTTTKEEELEYESRLIIKTVPPTIAREKILEMCNKVEGFDYLSLSEPQPMRKFHRIGWICFKPGTDIQHVFGLLDNQKVDDFIFHLALNRKNTVQSRPPRVAPELSQSTERLKKDLDQIRELTLALEAMLSEDPESGLRAVESRADKVISSLTEDDESVKIKKRLDMIIAYLRRVHMYCYYCAMECDSVEELNRKCCEPHCRSTVDDQTNTDARQPSKNEKGATLWAKNLDQKISMKVNTPDERELKKLGGKLFQTEIDEFVRVHVLKEHESKFKCQVKECSKAFKGYDYVEKHILTKHADEIDRRKIEVDYFNNYVCDPNHLLPNQQQAGPIAQQQPPPFIMRPPAISWEQIPRLGIDMPFRRPRADENLPKDPRQVKSYVDLDAPAEGDSNISFF